MGYAEKAHEATPQAAFERAENLKALGEELTQLDLRERAAVLLCCQEGLSLTDAAGALEESRETLRDRLARTVKRLRERLRRKGVELTPLLLLGLLNESRPSAAPESLCRGLDKEFPESSCKTIAEAGAPKNIPADVLASIGSGMRTASTAAAGIVLALVLMLVACFGFGVLSSKNTRSRDSGRADSGKSPINMGAPEVHSVAAVPTNEEVTEVKKKTGIFAAAAMASALSLSASADDGAAGRKEISKDEIKAAVRAVVANEKKAKSDASSAAPGKEVPSLREFRERD